MFKVNFDVALDFEPRNFSSLTSTRGIYFIFLKQKTIPYPFKESRLIYIGMSDKSTNSVGSRLNNHFTGKSGNFGLQNYRKVEKIKFTHINFEILQTVWSMKIEDLESYFLLNFVTHFGVYPICNNKTGLPDFTGPHEDLLEIDWEYFK